MHSTETGPIRIHLVPFFPPVMYCILTCSKANEWKRAHGTGSSHPVVNSTCNYYQTALLTSDMAYPWPYPESMYVPATNWTRWMSNPFSGHVQIPVLLEDVMIQCTIGCGQGPYFTWLVVVRLSFKPLRFSQNSMSQAASTFIRK